MLKEEFSNIDQLHKSILSVNGLDIKDCLLYTSDAADEV